MTQAYQAGPAADAKVLQDGNRSTLVFVRELRHRPDKVWTALTNPANLREWAPFDPDRDLRTTGQVMLTMAGPEPETLECSVTRVDAPRLLEYTWGGDVLRWELEEIETGTRLTLRHTLEERSWAPKVAAGWHICLDVAERTLDGHSVGRIVADDAKRVGWERLNAEYAERFGIENTGWPARSDIQANGTSAGPGS
jgi:uncharacterized protein YndB with AHSA1/START domain